MKRVGAIYSRGDTSKSKDKITKLPLKDITSNVEINETAKKTMTKKWKLEIDNEDSSSKGSWNENNRFIFETDCR